jgi:hypothetical protein
MISDNVPLSCESMIDEVSIALYWIIYLSKVGLAKTTSNVPHYLVYGNN